MRAVQKVDNYNGWIILAVFLAKYWMGHTVGSDIESRYIIPPENLQYDMYAKAYSYIDLRETRETEEALFAEIKVKLETMRPDQRRRYMQELKTIYGVKRMDRMLELKPDINKLLELSKTEGGMSFEYGERFEQINESDLLTYLRDGWQLVHNLGTGKVIVKK